MFNAKVTSLSLETKPAAEVVEIAREEENNRAGAQGGVVSIIAQVSGHLHNDMRT